MATIDRIIAASALLVWTALAPALGASSAASSASESVGFSLGSVSGSLHKSSASSSKTTDVAEGDYRILDVADLADRPGLVRLQLQALADPGEGGELQLDLPREAVDRSQLERGHVVAVRQRPYGVEFTDARTQQAFFLVLSDDWYRELRATAVDL